MASVSDWIAEALAWCESHVRLLSFLGAASFALLVATILLVPVLVGALPQDEFKDREAPRHAWRDLHPAIATSLRILRNAFGALCVVAGVALLVLPGQGLLTIFAGVLLLEFPGKRRLVLCVVSKRPIQRTLNWMRRRRRVPEFVFRESADQPPSRSERRARAEAKSARTTIDPDRPTKKKTSS